mgnify:CR=1 FL=1
MPDPMSDLFRVTLLGPGADRALLTEPILLQPGRLCKTLAPAVEGGQGRDSVAQRRADAETPPVSGSDRDARPFAEMYAKKHYEPA